MCRDKRQNGSFCGGVVFVVPSFGGVVFAVPSLEALSVRLDHSEALSFVVRSCGVVVVCGSIIWRRRHLGFDHSKALPSQFNHGGGVAFEV
jgi:hypothetical protein